MQHIWETTNNKIYTCKRCQLLKVKTFEKRILPNGTSYFINVFRYYNKSGIQGFKKCYEPTQLKLEL